ncbi:anaphase promoting complex subunit cdc16 [Apophysomyces sp. BC1015]|nr:anaphase promoting complex subunit cdc16 [Apophysomyces sp. BC1015]KAG0178649.1 anaphase promoting complex subunit cdc16 [Apophysomyces sp. BC1021]
MRQRFSEADLDTLRDVRLRNLRDEADHLHLPKAAAFFGDLSMAISDEVENVYALAQTYYQAQQYERALDLLNKKDTLIKSVECRYLAGMCSAALENWRDVLDYLGPENPFAARNTTNITFSSFMRDHPNDSTIKLESAMCYARGHAYLQLHEVTKAKNCFKEALTVDAKCYDALEALIQFNMLEEADEWSFVSSLPYREHCGEDMDFFRTLYMLKLKRFSHLPQVVEAQQRAENEYKAGKSLDVLHSQAETFLAESRFGKCLEICTERDPFFTNYIPAYVACLYELGKKVELYEIAQELVDRLNDKAVSWYVVGMYYLYVKKHQEARRYFTQSTTIDRNFEPAWLGYGHALAAEKDCDQAINAYTSCCKLNPGSHTPYMYIGMQYMEQNNMELAKDYLLKSMAKCSTDPFLLNEFGVYHYKMGEYHKSLNYYRKALALARDRQSANSQIWGSVWTNLGHAYRKTRDLDLALRCFRLALRRNPKSPDIHATMGMIYHLQQRYRKAIEEYEEAIRASHTHDFIIELLKRAYKESATSITPHPHEPGSSTDFFSFQMPQDDSVGFIDEEIRKIDWDDDKDERVQMQVEEITDDATGFSLGEDKSRSGNALASLR